MGSIIFSLNNYGIQRLKLGIDNRSKNPMRKKNKLACIMWISFFLNPTLLLKSMVTIIIIILEKEELGNTK